MYRLFRHILYLLLVLWGIISLLFFLFNVLPGDPVRMLTGQRVDPETLQNIRKDLGLDKPIWQQYLLYLNDLSIISLDNKKPEARYSGIEIISLGKTRLVIKSPYLRESFQTRRPVTNMIMEVLPASLFLAIFAIGIAVVIGIPLGILMALRQNSFIDKFVLSITSLGMALPSYFAAILIGWLFAFVLKDLTGLSLTGSLYEYDLDKKYLALQNIILPGITLGIRPLSVVVQLTRNSLLQEMGKNYFRTARAKGLCIREAIRKHALRNSLNPVITALSGWFASMLAGMVFVEYIFSWKGIGFMLVDGLNQYDFPVVMGCILIISIIFISMNYLTDFLYVLLDPRIRLSVNNK